MSKLSPSLKALLSAPFAKSTPTPAPPRIQSLYASLFQDAQAHNVPLRPWLALSAATTFTLNSPDSLSALYSVAASSSPSCSPLQAAELVREIGLKCISFNGIPRTINCLNAFRTNLPPNIAHALDTRGSRRPDSVEGVEARGRALWESVYGSVAGRLWDKLAAAHPDLPLVILHGHYGPLLAEPPEHRPGDGRLGRALTSLVAVACLRAQTGVGPQVVSHVLGLRRAVEDGTYETGTREDEAVRWLAGDEGSEWMIRLVDTISEALAVETARL